MSGEIVKLGSAKLASSGGAIWQALIDITSEPGDSESFGEIDVLQGLGLTSIPWPADDSGYAEGVVLRNVSNRNAICIGARDLRTAKAIGNAKPGDTIVHSTGPKQAAQLQLKEAKRQWVGLSKDSSGKGMAVMLDGTNDKIQVNGFGMLIEMSKKDGIKIDNGAGACIVLQDDGIYFLGNIHIPGLPPGLALQAGASIGDQTGLAPTVGVLGISQ